MHTGRTAVRRTTWAARYKRRLAVTDALVLLWAVLGAYLTRFGMDDAAALDLGGFAPSYLALSLLLGVVWFGALTSFDTRDPTVIGVGYEEYRRVVDASVRLFGLIAIVAYLTRTDVARGFLLLALPAGLAMLLVSRWMWRKYLHLQRRFDRWSDRVVVVGAAGHVRDLTKSLQREKHAGYHVVGLCVSDVDERGAQELRDELGVPVLGDPSDVVRLAGEVGASAVAVASVERYEELSDLGWQLEGTGTDLIVAPSLVQGAGPRVHTRPVGGLALLHVEAPRYVGANKVGKTLFDLVVASACIVVLSPLLVTIALLVRFTDPGPVIYRQRRIGLNGAPFDMLKFRTMVVDADTRLAELIAANEAAGPLFKMRDDPRVTRVGRVLRRYSLDELPQLFNVLNRTMSLVGPRPPLPHEVATYEERVARRLLMRPGMTGLWQVSGRSDLSWEDSVRLDLFYVENWSITEDLLILAKTLRAVVSSRGAY
ncbi:sugar transferase [Quadrisphaera sp. GCM10027208]|uniref:sugar transferase n=1 Tax=Quadrisphaera sp. GCM10027208 TaxID=3273423 RepID=UPI003612C172